MTEDDTFRVLARPGVHEMVKLHAQWEEDYRGRNNRNYTSLENLKFAKYYGWTWLEYLIHKKQAGYRY